MRNLRSLKNCLKWIFMLLAQEGRDFSLLHQIIFDWVLGTKYAPEYSHQLLKGFSFICAPPPSKPSCRKVLPTPQECSQREGFAHLCVRRACVPFSILGQKRARKGLSHWARDFPELQPQQGWQHLAANPWQINLVHLTLVRRSCWCPREEGTILHVASTATSPASNTWLVLIPWCAAQSPNCASQTQMPARSEQWSKRKKNVVKMY